MPINRKKRSARSKEEAERLFKQYLKKLHEIVDWMFFVAYNELEMDVYTWAEKAGLCANTIINLELYMTQRPQLRTIICMASAIGYKVELVPMNRVRVPAAKKRTYVSLSRGQGKRSKTLTIPTMVDV